jgi:hypothetical protein
VQSSQDIVSQLISQIGAMPEDKRQQVFRTAMSITRKFIPTPGPQHDAFNSKADILLYGGSAGSGKSALGVGLALTQHQRSLIMRREGTQLGALTEEAIRMNGTKEGFNGSHPQKLKTPDGRLIEFGAAQYPGDELDWRGQAHDLLYIDEAGEFLGSQVRNLIGWVRSVTDGQRCRVVLGTNPPTTAEGEYLVKMFAPWLDPTHGNPAKAGELRWFIMDDEDDIEVAGPGKYSLDGKLVEDEDAYYVETGRKPMQSMSRTFIPAKLADNPFLKDTDYAARLDMLPEPLRSAVRDGNFMISRRDDLWQVIPTDWIRAAQARWSADVPRGVPMCAMGVDIAQGGDDKTTIAMRYDGWFAPILAVPGIQTPTGNEIAGLVVANRRDGAAVILDMGGGYGGAAFMRLQDNGIEPIGYKGAAGTVKRTMDGKLKFSNTRIAAYWKLREALDPSQVGGSPIALPPDSELLSDLTAMRYQEGPHGIMPHKDSSTKVEVTKRLGRSPDKGDAVTMCWFGGRTVANTQGGWSGERNGKMNIVANVGYAHRKNR